MKQRRTGVLATVAIGALLVVGVPSAEAASRGSLTVCDGGYGVSDCDPVNGAGQYLNHCYGTPLPTYTARNDTNGTVYLYATGNCSGRGIGLNPNVAYNFGNDQYSYKFVS